jgi:hypothetical protein
MALRLVGRVNRPGGASLMSESPIWGARYGQMPIQSSGGDFRVRVAH